MKTKQEWRKLGKDILNSYSANEYAKITQKITEHVIRTDLWQNAKVIGLTISQGKEINTRPLIERAWEENKIVCVPKCLPKNKQMQFYKIDSFEQLERVYFNLLEPIVDQTDPVSKEVIDLLFVPGLLYDINGYRIGFGGGYYDRYLSGFTNPTVSILSNQQIIEKVPVESFDIPVQLLITENGVISK